MISPLCLCVRYHAVRRITPSLFENLSSINLPACNRIRNQENVLLTTYRSYNKPAVIKKEGLTVVDQEKKVDIGLIEEEKKLPLVERLVKKMMKGVAPPTMKRYKLLKASSYLYEQLVDEVNIEEFFNEFELPDTFASWFIIMELHLYVLSARLFKEPKFGIHARDMLTDTFWNDVQHRSMKLGPRASVYRKKHLFILSLQMQAAFYGYDEGIQSNDMVLAAVVWRRIFAFECDDALKIERLVYYIRVQMDYLNTLSFDDIVFNRKVLTIPLKNVQVS